MYKRHILIAFICIAFLKVNAQNDKMDSFIDNLMSQMIWDERCETDTGETTGCC